ncbi:MAG: DUF4266 domain-containing protein [Caedimonadaceae bacterium]|nr:MAG: DUF4266 domain-containing protein [Caedimonadaceae bacterium]
MPVSYAFYFRTACILALSFTAGCTNVEPWERGMLAQPHMALDLDGQDAAFRDHMYFSREGTSGGYGLDGGGCGCN